MPLIERTRAPALAIGACVADAGQPLVTDDAAVVAPKTCQLEGGVRATRDDRLWFAQPACNFGGDLEWSAGGAHLAPDEEASSTVVQLQLKSVLWRRSDGRVSLGASLGALRDTGAPHGRSAFQLYYARGLASWYPRDGLEFDLNVGAANGYGAGTYALAGVAATATVVTGIQLLGEVFHDEPGPWKFQLGVGSAVVTDRIELYASYGSRFNSSAGGIVVAGFRLQSPAFLP
jgi:hypothetical protein